jgi:Zn-dependent peptidase ImmA (M78 family)
MLGRPGGPLLELQSVVESLGLLPFAFDLGSDVIDGGYVRVNDIGVALINGALDAGRRRFSLAHELGHHLLADEYTVDFGVGSTREEREALINAFAIHFLLPLPTPSWLGDDEMERAGLHLGPPGATWGDHRMRLVVLAAEYRVSWSAVVSHARTLGLIDRSEHDVLRARRPVAGDYVETGISIVEELAPMSLPSTYAQAVVRAYRRSLISATRAVELLHRTLTREDLPRPGEAPIESLTREFEELG